MVAWVGCDGGLVGCVGCEARVGRLRSWRRSVAKLGFEGCDNCVGVLQRPTVFFTNLVFVFHN